MKKIILLFLIGFVSSCAPAHYDILPGTYYNFYNPKTHIDLKGRAFSFEFHDNRGELKKINCSEVYLDRQTDLEGEFGFNFFCEYIKSMVEQSNGKIDSESPSKLVINLDGLSSRVTGVKGYGLLFYHGLVQFTVVSGSLEKTYCTGMNDHQTDAPITPYSRVSRERGTQLMVSGAMRKSIESFLMDVGYHLFLRNDSK